MSTKNIITILLVVLAGVYLTINAKKENQMIENNYEFIENDLLPVEYTLNLNLNRAYTGGKTVIKPTKKQI